MVFKIAYWVISLGSLGVLALEAPSGALLTGSPERGKVTAAKPEPGQSTRTVRGRPAYIWLGGGYHGGK